MTEQSYALEFTPAALRDLRKLDPFIRRRVFEDIEKLSGNPRPYGVEKLETEEKLYRVYAGPGKGYRVIYQIPDEKRLVLIVRWETEKKCIAG